MPTRKSHNGSPSPKSRQRAMADDFSIKDNQELADRHAGKWVAVKNGKTVAHSKDSAQVFRTLSSRRVRGAVIHFIPARPTPSGHQPES